MSDPMFQFGYSLDKQKSHLARSQSSSSVTGQSADANDKQILSSNMDWLYRMIGVIDTNTKGYNLNQNSRAWLVRRVDESAEDTALSSTCNTDHVWWEHDAEQNKQLDDQELQQPIEISSDDSDAKESDSVTALPQLKLEEVLDTPVFLSDFRNHLEENFTAQDLNFLEAYDNWADLDHNADISKFVKDAYRIYDRFIDRSGEEIVSIPIETRNRVQKAVHNASVSLKKGNLNTAQCAIKLHEVMGLARKHVLEHIETVLFPRFLKSEEYEEMIAVRFEDDSESKGAATAYKGPQWVNTEGYQSVHVTINMAENLLSSKKVWCLVSVDSRTHRTSSVRPVRTSSAMSNMTTWEDDFQFPILSTTQHAKISVWTTGLVGDRFLGRAYIPIAAIPGKESKTHEVKLLPRRYGEQVQGKVYVDLSLSTDKAKDLGKKLVRLDDDEDNNALANVFRGLVSKKKKRFKEDGFDLDLTYCTDRIIAMGFPSEGTEGVYRNNMKDVQRFFEKRHHLSYMIYNLCSERFYDSSKFNGRVVRIPFDDHNPPSVEQIKDFCDNVHRWLSSHPQHVVSIHCKAGKGRTGTMIAAYFVYARICKDATSALNYFGVQRTKNGKGVTIPSQMRFVHYFDHYCRLRRNNYAAPPKKSFFLNTIIFHNIPKSMMSGDVVFTVIQNNRHGSKFKSKGFVTCTVDKDKSKMYFHFGEKPILLSENIRIQVYQESSFGNEKVFQIWFNTRYTASVLAAQRAEEMLNFLRQETSSVTTKPGEINAYSNMGINCRQPKSGNRLLFSKDAIDKINKDKKHKMVPKNFQAELLFAEGKARTNMRGSNAMNIPTLTNLYPRERESRASIIANPTTASNPAPSKEQQQQQESSGTTETKEEQEKAKEESPESVPETDDSANDGAAAADDDDDEANANTEKKVLKVGNLFKVKM